MERYQRGSEKYTSGRAKLHLLRGNEINGNVANICVIKNVGKEKTGKPYKKDGKANDVLLGCLEV